MMVKQSWLTPMLAEQGVVPWYPHSGRFDFSAGGTVYRWCWLAEPDPAIRADLQPVCQQLESLDAVAWSVANYLSALAMPAWFLMPHVHWEHELLDHCPEVWRDILHLLAQPMDDPLLTGANAVKLILSTEMLVAVIARLLEGLTQADALLLTEAPLILKVHHHRQVWVSTTDPAWLPTDHRERP